MHDIIIKVVELLKLKKPYKIVLKSTIGKNAAEYFGMYRKNGLCGHTIRISVNNLASDSRCINTLIVHEFIHAWQEEVGLTEVHGPYFKKMAKILAEEFNLPRIYLKNADKP